MAQIFKAKKKKSPQLKAPAEVVVERLDPMGQGVARCDGRPLFVAGVLPGEMAEVRITQDKRSWMQAELVKITQSSPERIAPHCPYFGQCGGCSLQMLPVEAQHRFKEESVRELFAKFAGETPAEFAPMLIGPERGYRQRARLHFVQDRKSGALSFGFRRRGGRELIEVSECPTLAPELSRLLVPLRELFNTMRARRQLGHLELYRGTERPLLFLRLTAELGENDRQKLVNFADEWQVDISLKVAEAEPVSLIGADKLSYQLSESGITLSFRPGDFIQVNPVINEQMVSQALQWLSPQRDDRVLDLFCGIGNFSLPLAKQCSEVIAIEGVEQMVVRVRENAAANGIDNIECLARDLEIDGLPKLGKIDRVLLDPARPGAAGVMAQLVKLKPESVVYVSCNPVTLARDSRVLLEGGYRLAKIALMDMFPDTEHMETMVLFIR